jgi:sodium-dependent dicarboxylate transporter 2/3/5
VKPDAAGEAPLGTEERAAVNGQGFAWPADRPEDLQPALLPPAPPGASRLRRNLAWLGCLTGAAVLVIPGPAGLPPTGQATFAVFLIAVTLWVTNVLPIGITGLLAMALLALTGGLEPAEAWAAFGNSAVFFILSVFILATAVIQSGLSKRLALLFLRRFEGGAFRLVAGVMIVGAVMTVWMPNQATAAMLFPIVLEIARAARLRPGGSAYGQALFLSLAWGVMLGANASVLGSARVPLALELLNQRFDLNITFAGWLLASLPIVVVGLITGLVLLRIFYRAEPVDLEAARTAIEEGVRQLGPMGRREALVSGVMAMTIAAWILLGGQIDRAAIAVLGAAAIFALGLLRWGDLDGFVQWGIVLMYGGAVAVGVALDRSGAAAWLADGVFAGARLPSFAVLAILALLSVALSEVMSNAAAVATLLPLGFTLAAASGLDPVVITLATCYGAGLGFMLPISSAPNTIVYASGYIRTRDMVLAGGLMDAFQLALLLATARMYWPHIRGLLD